MSVNLESRCICVGMRCPLCKDFAQLLMNQSKVLQSYGIHLGYSHKHKIYHFTAINVILYATLIVLTFLLHASAAFIFL